MARRRPTHNVDLEEAAANLRAALVLLATASRLSDPVSAAVLAVEVDDLEAVLPRHWCERVRDQLDRDAFPPAPVGTMTRMRWEGGRRRAGLPWQGLEE